MLVVLQGAAAAGAAGGSGAGASAPRTERARDAAQVDRVTADQREDGGHATTEPVGSNLVKSDRVSRFYRVGERLDRHGTSTGTRTSGWNARLASTMGTGSRSRR